MLSLSGKDRVQFQPDDSIYKYKACQFSKDFKGTQSARLGAWPVLSETRAVGSNPTGYHKLVTGIVHCNDENVDSQYDHALKLEF